MHAYINTMQPISQSQSHLHVNAINAINDINEKFKQQRQPQPKPQSHVNAINDIYEKIEQQQQQIHSHEIRDPYGILHFLELRRSRL